MFKTHYPIESLQLPYEPVCPSVGQLVARPVGLSACLSVIMPKKEGSFTSMLLSEHLFTTTVEDGKLNSLILSPAQADFRQVRHTCNGSHLQSFWSWLL